MCDEREEIKKVIHEFTQHYRNEWTGFQAAVHLQDTWTLPEQCMDDQYEEQVVDMVMALVDIIEKSTPITEIVKFISEGYKVFSNVRNECELTSDFTELRLYCKAADCSVSAITQRAYKHIKLIRDIADDMEHEEGETEESQFNLGYNSGHIATLVLGLTNTVEQQLKESL